MGYKFIFELTEKGISKHIYRNSVWTKHMGFNISFPKYSIVCLSGSDNNFAVAIYMFFLYIEVAGFAFE